MAVYRLSETTQWRLFAGVWLVVGVLAIGVAGWLARVVAGERAVLVVLGLVAELARLAGRHAGDTGRHREHTSSAFLVTVY